MLHFQLIICVKMSVSLLDGFFQEHRLSGCLLLFVHDLIKEEPVGSFKLVNSVGLAQLLLLCEPLTQLVHCFVLDFEELFRLFEVRLVLIDLPGELLLSRPGFTKLSFELLFLLVLGLEIFFVSPDAPLQRLIAGLLGQELFGSSIFFFLNKLVNISFESLQVWIF